ncbi:MAG: hypothetical protein R2787_04685 [Saprospiraceae bacterium]
MPGRVVDVRMIQMGMLQEDVEQMMRDLADQLIRRGEGRRK